MLVAGDRMFLVTAIAQDFYLASEHGIYRDCCFSSSYQPVDDVPVVIRLAQ
jgi:hypothetical protein